MIAGAIAGLAGFLLANATEFVSPAYMSWQRSGELIIMVMLGGIGTLHGAIVGAASCSAAGGGARRRHRALEADLRAVLVLIVLFAHGGLIGLRAASDGGAAVTEPVLRIDGLHKSFGGLVVTDDVSLEIGAGELHAVIGPNGAGKTTLINQISGPLGRRSGTIVFDGSDITPLPPTSAPSSASRARSRSPPILPRFSALENVALAVQARSGSSFRFCRPARPRGGARTSRPWRRSAEVGLEARADVLAGTLSHGEKRALELAIALAHEAEAAAARRADGRHRPRGDRAADRGCCGGSRAASPSCWSSTTWRRCSRSPTASRCWSTAASSRPARRPRCAPIPQVRAAYLGEEMTPMLSVEDLAAGYGPAQVLFGVELRRRRRRGGDADRPQRHGQDHDHPRADGPAAAAAAAARPSTGGSLVGLPPYRIAQAGIGLVPEGRQIFPTLTVEENLVATARRALRQARWTLDARLRVLSRASPSGAATWATSSPAASSRCWRSAAR